MRNGHITRVLLIALGLLPATGLGGALSRSLTLSVDSRFPIMGGTSTFTLTGPPDMHFEIYASPSPAEVFFPGWGTAFIDTNNLTRVGQGNLSPAGIATVTLAVPSTPTLVDTVWYFQARAWSRSNLDRGISTGSLSIRLASSAPTGARRPEALAVTPDGTRAFVVNEADGTVQVLDAANDLLLDEIPIAPPPPAMGLPIEAAIDPEGRHLFVVNPQMPQISVIHTATGSVAAQIPVPKSSRDVAFDFSGIEKKIYVTNERDQTVLVFKEAPAGTFTQIDTLVLQGRGPGPIALLPSGQLMVGNRVTHELEVIDPSVPGGATVARTSLKGIPNDIVISGSRALVPSFTVPEQGGVGDGDNVLLVVDLSNFQVTVQNGLANLGTDYFDAAVADPILAVLGSGSGSVLLADTTTLSLLERIDLAPGEPTTNPYQAAFVSSAAPVSQKLYVVNHFRETVRPVDLTSGPPFSLLPEIALARSGQPRVPLVDLTPLENGEWFYSTVEFFNGTARNPNRVTCNTCHPHTFASGFKHPNTSTGKQAPPLFDVGNTGPWLWKGTVPDLLAKTQALFTVHGRVGGTSRPEATQGVFDFQRSGTRVPVSPFLEPDGSLSPAAQRGKTIFEVKANCSSCHTAPLFIPVPPNPMTISLGVGVGLAPDNVTSLRGLWSSAPYLWNGAAATLRDVIVNNPGDQHGTTSTLTQEEIDDLVEFLKTL